MCIHFRATTLYDRPGPQFKKITLIEKHFLLEKMKLNEFTVMSESGEVQLKSDRPGLLVSSTSWTPDEDFSILMKALQSIVKIEHTSYGFILTYQSIYVINWLIYLIAVIAVL